MPKPRMSRKYAMPAATSDSGSSGMIFVIMAHVPRMGAACRSEGEAVAFRRGPWHPASCLSLDAIYHVHAAVGETLAVLQLKVDLPAHGMECRNPGAEQHRVDVEADFVDQVALEQRSRELAAPHEADVLALFPLERAHELHGVPAHERDP